MQAIEIKVIKFSPDFGGNPLPYVPAFREWTDHVASCVQCAHADQLAEQAYHDHGEADVEHLFSLLCEGGAQLQTTVSRRMHDQHEISLRN